MKEPIRPGKYRHFKGGIYEVIGVARHSETDEHLVVYRPLSGDGSLWVRPLTMFQERIPLGTRTVPRFEFLGEGSLSSIIALTPKSTTETDRH